MKNANAYVITRRKEQIVSFLFQNHKAVEIHCDDVRTEYSLGDIYIGRVRDVVKHIGAAFIEIAPGQICHLSLKDLRNPVYTKKGASLQIQQGDELLVQISRDEIKSKYLSVTTNLTFHGKYLLLTTGNDNISVSRKIGKEKKEQIKELLNSWLEPEREKRSFGILARTNAEFAETAVLKTDFNRVYDQYETLMRQASFRTVYSCLIKAPSMYLSRLSDLYDTMGYKLVTDDETLYEEIQSYLIIHHPDDLTRLEFYQDKLITLDKLYSLEHHLSEALNKRVWLKCGGYLVIEPTEALTVIDVNTGKYEGGKDKEKAFLKVNLEAAEGIAHQLRLRNISGIVIADFINMETPESVQLLLNRLRELLFTDPIRTNLVDMTKLSLVEITRQKKEKPLYESIIL